jgi:PAS domain S-box-containing protein
MNRFSLSHRNVTIPLGLATAASLAGLLLGQMGPAWVFVPFIAAVMAAGWSGGIFPGLATTVLSAAMLLFLRAFGPSIIQETLTPDLPARVGLFGFMGVVATYLAVRCQHAVTAHERLQRALAQAGEAWIFLDLEGRITYLNPLAQKWAGWTSSNARGRSVEQLFAFVHGHKAEVLSLDIPQVLAQRAALPLPDGVLLLGSNGERIPVAGSLQPIQEGTGEVVELLLILRQASTPAAPSAAPPLPATPADPIPERRWPASLAAELGVGLLLLDEAGHCDEANGAACELLGCSPAEMTGYGWLRGLPSAERDKVLAALELPAEAGCPATVEFRLESPRGKAHWLRLRLQAVRPRDDEHRRWVAVIENLSELRQLADTLEDARQEARQTLAELQEVQERLGQENHALRESVEQLRRDLASLTGQLAEKTRELEQAHAELALLRDRLSHEEPEQLPETDQNAQRCAELEARLEAVSQAKALAEQEAESARREAEDLRKELSDQQEAYQKLKAESEQILQDALDAEAHAERERRALQNRIGELEMHLELLSQERNRSQALHAEQASRWASEKQQFEESLARLKQLWTTEAEKSQRLASLFDALPHAVVALDREGRVALWNAAASRVFQKNREEVQGNPLEASWLASLGLAYPSPRQEQRTDGVLSEVKDPTGRWTLRVSPWDAGQAVLTVTEESRTAAAGTVRRPLQFPAEADWLDYN